jgi:hypothetical protein
VLIHPDALKLPAPVLILTQRLSQRVKVVSPEATMTKLQQRQLGLRDPQRARQGGLAMPRLLSCMCDHLTDLSHHLAPPYALIHLTTGLS